MRLSPSLIEEIKARLNASQASRMITSFAMHDRDRTWLSRIHDGLDQKRPALA